MNLNKSVICKMWADYTALLIQNLQKGHKMVYSIRHCTTLHVNESNELEFQCTKLQWVETISLAQIRRMISKMTKEIRKAIRGKNVVIVVSLNFGKTNLN